MPRAKTSRLYLIPILSKALDILELLDAKKKPLTLEDIFRHLDISKTSVYRILKTLVHRGYLAQAQDGRYRSIARPKKIRFGFAGQSASMPFSEAVTASLRHATTNSGIELVIFDNKYDPEVAMCNAAEFLNKGVDLVIEFQIDAGVAPAIGHVLSTAGIPVIAVDIPHPHATYFGVDNFQVGFEAGDLLAQYAIQNWKGATDWVVGLDIAEAGSFVQSRITGAFLGVRSRLPRISADRFLRLEGGGLRRRSHAATAAFLRTRKKHKVLIAAATDTSALGALQAVREAGMDTSVAIVGQDCIPEVLKQMRADNGPFIGSISHEAETYGSRLVQLGLAILRGSAVPPYNFVHHKLVTPASLKESPRNDSDYPPTQK